VARRGSPLVVLVSWAVTVSMVLLVAWKWTDAHATLRATPDLATDPAAVDAAALATPMLSARRAPGVLARQLDLTSLQRALTPMLDTLGDSSCAAVAVDGQVVASKNPTTAVVPASTMKIVTAAVAEAVLGPFDVYTTRVTGSVDADGTIKGDLYLVGGGDPVLTTDEWPNSGVQTYPPINTTRLEALADAVVAKGVKKIVGDVVGDGSRYDDEWFAPSWTDQVKGVEAGPYDALLVNDSRATATQLALNPAEGAAKVFLDLLTSRGVQIVGKAASGQSADSNEIATVNSQPMSKVLEEMLTTSDNNTAEMVLKEIGLQTSGIGSRDAGAKAVESTLRSWGVPMDGVLLADGSGLSHDDRLTCAALVAVLQHGNPIDAVGSGLPIAGKTGTLAGSFTGTALVDRLHAKTGTLGASGTEAAASSGRGVVTSSTTPGEAPPPEVKALAGYVLPVQDGGSTITFALVLNGDRVTDPAVFEPVWYQELAPALASYPSAAPIRDLLPR
jgi:D-alanyl-D-alanine carboxypeptidase/D-alanyl-D-alanine-endopeptidase (penicillin-binding protein 4)